MNPPQNDDTPRPLVSAFPMPTRPELSKAYDDLFQAANGDVEVRRALGNPALLPRPWIPASCTTRQLRAELWLWLDDVVSWLNHEYVWDPTGGLIPPCWPLHPHLINELAVLADQRRRAALDLTSSTLEDWHRHCLPAFNSRLQGRLRTGCDDKHSTWPAQPRYDRHHRNSRLRTDTFNGDLVTLAANVEPSIPPLPDQAARTAALRLAADNGEVIDPITGEAR